MATLLASVYSMMKLRLNRVAGQAARRKALSLGQEGQEEMPGTKPMRGGKPSNKKQTQEKYNLLVWGKQTVGYAINQGGIMGTEWGEMVGLFGVLTSSRQQGAIQDCRFFLRGTRKPSKN